MLGLAISVVALYFALRDVHWREVGSAIRQADYLLIALAVLIFLVSLALRAGRWGVLFHPRRGISFYHLFGTLNVAYLINNVLPFQVGDLGRAYLLSEIEGISTTRSLSTVLVERMLDVLTLLVFFLILIPFVDIPSRMVTPMTILAGVVAVVIVGAVVASLRRPFVIRLVDWVLLLAPARARPKLMEMAHSALDGLSVLSQPRVAAELIAWSAVTWLTVGLVVYTAMNAFGLNLGLGAALFVLIATSFGFLVPSSPGSFGVYHSIVIWTLTNVFHIDRNAAVSYALVVHLVFYLPPMLLGLVFLWRERQLWSGANFMSKLRELQGEPPAADTTAADARS